MVILDIYSAAEHLNIGAYTDIGISIGACTLAWVWVVCARGKHTEVTIP